MTLWFIRHTRVSAIEGLCYGRTDVPLAETFHAEARAVRDCLPPSPWRVLSSPAPRCRQLATSLANYVELDHRLLELDFGDWENRRWLDLPRDETDFWLADFVTRRPPGGESFADLAARARAFVDDVHQRFPNESLLIVTHAGVIRALLAAQLNQSLHDAFSIPVPFGSVHPITLA